VASAIATVTIAGAVSLLGSVIGATGRNQDNSTALSLARHAIEEVRQRNFVNAPEGTSTLTYNANGAVAGVDSASTAAYYQVTTTITSSSTVTVSGASYPTTRALRTVVVVVRRIRDNAVLARTGTLLTRSGI